MRKKLLNSAWLLGIAATLLGLYLRIVLRCTRWTLEGDEYLAPFLQDRPVVVAFWHECLPLMPAFWQRVRVRNRARGVTVLVSRHRDGRFIGRLVAQFGIGIVHGSSARPGRAREYGGAAGLRALHVALRRNKAVVITPDGPRGPRRQAALGVTMLAGLAGVPVLPMGAATRWRIGLKTWDLMPIPLPFGRGVLTCLAPIPVTAEAAEASLPVITDALNQAVQRAEILCRA